ncbi:MAG TPA: glycosyltransferase [Patescibacteria group bacterium]|nr:glycosyltransferase [Patescibacteria group bacterium]
MRSEIKQIAKVLLNPGSLRYRIVKKVATTIHILPSSSPDINYSEWVERTEPFSWSKLKILNEQPLISIIVPVYNPPAKYFYPMVYSVVNQENYENWELVLVNASSNKKIKKLADEITQIDRRIKVINTLNKGIAQNTNLGINQAKGEYIGLLDHDDTLAPRALYEVGRLHRMKINQD